MSDVKTLLKKGSLALAGNAVIASAAVGRALAATDTIEGGAQTAQGNTSDIPLTTQIANITNTMLFAIGVVAVIMLIVGGFRYIFSGGNSQSVNAAKDTILYAVIGIVVAILAYAIVNFILGQFGGTAAG
ncbi:MAG: pilin [Candidatus Saccharibacteria bacterium]|jgi:magnesium-transporting ATPase (P-type)